MDDFMDLLRVFGFIAFAFILVVSGVAGIGYPLEKASCEARWADSNYESDYGFFAGCRIKIKGVWIPDAALRSIKEMQE